MPHESWSIQKDNCNNAATKGNEIFDRKWIENNQPREIH